MNEQREKQTVQRVFDAALSGIREDPGLAQRVLEAARENGQSRRRGMAGRVKWGRRILLAALGMALLATGAYAWIRPAVLNWLLGDAPANDCLEEMAQTVAEEAAVDSIAVRITGVLFDGEQFAFSYELENTDPENPALVAIDDVYLLNGEQARLLYSTAGANDPQMVPSPHLDTLPARRNPVNGGGWSQKIGIPLQETGACEMTVIVYRPRKGYAVVLEPESMLLHAEEYDEAARAEIADSLNTLESFKRTCLIRQEEGGNAQIPTGYTVVDSSGRLRTSAGEADASLKETGRIRVRFTFDAAHAFACDFSSFGAVQREDCVLRVRQFRLSPLSTDIDLLLIPTENSEAAAQKLALKYGQAHLTDGQGLPVEYSDMDYLNHNAPAVMQIEERWVCRYQIKMPGLQRFPEQIGFAVNTGEILCFPLTIGE